MICPSCGADNPDDARFCQNCGASTAPAPPAERRCESCGAANASDAKFCTVCGKPMAASSRDGAAAKHLETPPLTPKPPWHRPLAIFLWVVALLLLFIGLARIGAHANNTDSCILHGGGDACRELRNSDYYFVGYALFAIIAGFAFWRKK